jgi:hypothetical protein
MKQIIIYFWNNDIDAKLPAEDQLLDFITGFKNIAYHFTAVFLPYKINVEGYGFGFSVPEKKKTYVFKTLPKSATIEQIKEVVSDITSGKFKYVENDIGSGNFKENFIEVPFPGIDDSEGGVIPLDLLPDGLRKLLDSIFAGLGLDKLSLSWWIYAALAAYGGTKVLQKNSNKYLWGSATAFLVYAAIKRYNRYKQEVKNV